jgi:hypothetical protein
MAKRPATAAIKQEGAQYRSYVEDLFVSPNRGELLCAQLKELLKPQGIVDTVWGGALRAFIPQIRALVELPSADDDERLRCFLIFLSVNDAMKQYVCTAAADNRPIEHSKRVRFWDTLNKALRANAAETIDRTAMINAIFQSLTTGLAWEQIVEMKTEDDAAVKDELRELERAAAEVPEPEQ